MNKLFRYSKMKILIAPNDFKGSLKSIDAAKIIAQAFQSVSKNFSVEILPVSDGGTGFLDVVTYYLKAHKKTAVVQNPIGKHVDANWAIADGNTAIIELAQAAGLHLLNTDEYAPLQASTFGVGQLIKNAIDCNCSKIILGLGGSATIDAGAGILEALGVEFFDNQQNKIRPLPLNMAEITQIDFSKYDTRIDNCSIQLVCDVENVLFGNQGAIKIFAPQKGANESVIKILEHNLFHFIKILQQHSANTIFQQKYSGAAGGAAIGISALKNIEIASGASYIFKLADVKNKLASTDVLIIGEGKLDSQSLMGKITGELAKAAVEKSVKCVALCGQYENIDNKYFNAIFSIQNQPVCLAEAIQKTRDLLYETAKQLARLLII